MGRTLLAAVGVLLLTVSAPAEEAPLTLDRAALRAALPTPRQPTRVHDLDLDALVDWVARHPDDPHARLALARAHRARGDNHAASRYLAEAERRARERLAHEATAAAHLALARVLAEQGRPEFALAHAHAGIEAPTAPADALLFTAALELRGTDTDEARARCRDLLGRAREALNQGQGEIRQLCSFVALDAALLALNGDVPEAGGRLSFLMTLCPESDSARRLLDVLRRAGWDEGPVILRIGSRSWRLEDLLHRVGAWTLVLPPHELAEQLESGTYRMAMTQVLAGIARREFGDIVVEEDVLQRIARDTAELPLDAPRGEVDDALRAMRGVDSAMFREYARETAIVLFWERKRLEESDLFEVVDGSPRVRPRAVRRIHAQHATHFDERHGVMGAVWNFTSGDGSPSRSESRSLALARARKLAERVKGSSGVLDVAALAVEFGLREGDWSVSGDYILRDPCERILGTEVSSWLFDPARRPGEVRVFEHHPDRPFVMAVTAVRPARTRTFEEARAIVEEVVDDSARARIRLETFLDALETGDLVGPPALITRALEQAEADLQVLRENAPWLYLEPATWSGELPLGVFTSLDAAMQEAAACDCRILVHVDPNPADDRRFVDDATLERLTRRYVVLVVSGQNGDPEGDRVRRRYPATDDGARNLLLDADGRLVRGGLPVDGRALVEALGAASPN